MSSSYNDLVNVSSFGKKRENFEQERGDFIHYCRDCMKEVAVEIIDEDKAVFKCTVCQGANISSGSATSIREFYAKRK